ncbi:ABC transporter permease [Hoeflea prorocentri]|uniref:ABC transporter permease n=1 Tax=Hoeflea prorocentri TaxID=1922333 RepID=A0A9X3UET8_9HYPH|nr:ABC transporter permease [Hoeflea prorocentri]MCY6379997.1 ABC transporter permease [Hoeflea prorocentri]MDA5397797.1 ABC transporter permease [Hoeflea prorocentri]
MSWLAAMRMAFMALVSWLAAVAVSFVLIRLIPGDPVDIFANRMNVHAGDELVAAYRQAWGLDHSLIEQFFIWLKGFVTLDWGVSFVTGGSVSNELAPRLAWSAAIGFGGMIAAICFGTFLGFRAALHPGGMADSLSRSMAVAGQALPAFAVGLLALWLFAAELRWLLPFSGSTVERLVLPVALVAFFSIGSVSRLVRTGFAETAAAPFMRTALAKGLSRKTALWRHGGRQAAIVLVAGIAPDLAWIVGGTAIAEIVFGIPGLSERVVDAVSSRDYPVLQSYIALVALWIIFGLHLCALLRHTLDPRIGSLPSRVQ